MTLLFFFHVRARLWAELSDVFGCWGTAYGFVAGAGVIAGPMAICVDCVGPMWF